MCMCECVCVWVWVCGCVDTVVEYKNANYVVATDLWSFHIKQHRVYIHVYYKYKKQLHKIEKEVGMECKKVHKQGLYEW